MTEIYKILFLDLDEIVNGASKPEFGIGYPESHLEKHLIEKINKITDATQAKIVISSSWRIQYEFEELVLLLRKQGITGIILDKTPRLLSESYGVKFTRADEISTWLKNQDFEIQKFAILDDEIDELISLQSHLVLTNYITVINDNNVEEAIRLLQ